MIINYYKFITESVENEKEPEDFNIWEYEIVDGNLDCYQNVNINRKQLTEFPFKFGKISQYRQNGSERGEFQCLLNKLTTLLNGPTSVESDFNCSYNNLVNLIYGPVSVGGDYNCINNHLTSLEGSPEIINGDFFCGSNSLTTLTGSPKKVKGDFNCSINPLKNFDGCPEFVGGNFVLSDKIFKRIEDFPLCKIGGDISHVYQFDRVLKAVKANPEKFEGLYNNKTAFHQMVMRMDPSLIQYYKTIQPPSKKSILLSI